MELKFRNIKASPNDSVSEWGTEGIVTALERGTIFHWKRMVLAALSSAEVYESLEEALQISENTKVVRWVKEQLRREGWNDLEKVAHKLRLANLESGLSQKEFARELGTSASRFSTYLSAMVSPRAELVEKALRVSREKARESRGDRQAGNNHQPFAVQ
jgi:hypothetical protein